ncbi:MAG TPA: tail fiber domain-containing protein [Polyangiaceae bacterium]|nr:tail fiber domain-containing protein [Polyangiaceae bacterium]
MGWNWSNLVNPTAWKDGIVKSWHDLTGLADESQSSKDKRNNLNQQGQASSDFAGQGEGAFGAMRGDVASTMQALKDQAAGRNSVSAEQLRQALQQNVAAQASMAASANPANSAMAARTAMIQGGRLGSGLAGQQAVAGLQERQQAEQALAAFIAQQRALELQAAEQSRQNAISAYGGVTPEKSTLDKWAGPISSGLSLFTRGGGTTTSDERAKTAIKNGDDAANKTLEGLRAYVYQYKSPKNGKGPQLGVMAQDMEKSGLKHAVIDTPMGKLVDGAKAATSALALVAALGERVRKLEGK